MSALWNLPEPVCRAIGSHHHTNVDLLDNLEDCIMVSLIVLSEHILFKLPLALSHYEKFFSLQIESEDEFNNILSKLNLEKCDYDCLESNIEELVNLM